MGTLVFSYAAAVIGAGFASGQEIVSYFVRFGNKSIFGLFVSAAIFGLFAYAVTYECARHKTTDYDAYLRRIMPGKAAAAIKYFTLVFAVITLAAMAAGGAAMGESLLKYSELFGAAAVVIPAIFAVEAFRAGALRLNAAIGAVILIGIISCCIYLLEYREHQTFLNSAKMTASAVSYAGYNLITAGPVLAKLSGSIKTRGEAAFTGIASGMALFFAMFLIWALLSIYYGKINLGELPVLTLAMRENKPITIICSVILFLALTTTAIAAAADMQTMLGDGAALVLCAAAFLLGSAGFAFIVNYAYRVCGYIGIFVAGYMIVRPLKKRKPEINGENKRL